MGSSTDCFSCTAIHLDFVPTQALKEMADQDDEGKVTCPRSGYRCAFTDLKKVYLS